MAPKRRGSLANIDKNLKDLARRLPPEDAFFDNLFSLQESAPRPEAMDRTAAIASAQYLEYALQKAILAHLKKDISEREIKELFDEPGAPIGSLSAKIRLAVAMGIIDHEEKEDLDTIRNIRNTFAHSMTHITFDDEAVQRSCFSLHAVKNMEGVSGIEDVLGAKGLYVAAVGQLYFKTITYFAGRPPWMK
jgi:DNA-binding MltR family transcriptional regulator